METQIVPSVKQSQLQKIFPTLSCQRLSIPDILYYKFNIFPFQTSFDILYILGPYIRAW